MPRAKHAIKFTKKALLAIEPTGTRFYITDEATPGLQLVVQASGAKAFLFYRWLDGRPERLKVGDFPALSVDQARRQVRAMLGDVARGVNPAEKRRGRKEAATFGDAWEAWRARSEKHYRKHGQYCRLYAKYLKGLSRKLLVDIKRMDIVRIHQEIGATRPIQANRVKTLASSIFQHALEVGLYDGSNPARGIRGFPENQRARYLNADELRRFIEALDSEPRWADYFRLCLFSGARSGNVRTMRWDDLDLDRGVWHVPASDSKNAREMSIVLAPAAVDLLKARTATRRPGEAYVFPARGVTGPTVEPRKAWLRLCERAGLKGVVIHDLRRTTASIMAQQGTSLLIIGKALGHESSAVTQIYARLADQPIRAAVTQAVNAMLEVTKPRKQTA